MRHGGRRDDIDGVRITAHPRRGALRPGGLLLAVVVVVAVGVWFVGRRAEGVEGRPGAPPADMAASGDALPAGDPTAARSTAAAAGPRTGRTGTRSDPAGRAGPGSPAGPDGEDATSDLSDYVLPGEAPSMEQVIDALHARGIRTGLGAFPPPGTRPPVRGLAVPDDFPLPDGYVRHHQVTDDGQPIAAILMFAPDRDSILVRGVRVPVPAHRIVPPELAPPGLPVRWVVIPPPRDAGGRP